MRKLNGSDIFAALRAVEETGMRERLKALTVRLAESEEKPTNLKAVGLDGLAEILLAFSSKEGERAFWEFLSGPMETPPEDLRALELTELAARLRQLAAENDLQRFFDSFSSMMRSRWRT